MNRLKVSSNGILYKLLFLGGFFFNYSVERTKSDSDSLLTEQLTERRWNLKIKLSEKEKKIRQRIERIVTSWQDLRNKDFELFTQLSYFIICITDKEYMNGKIHQQLIAGNPFYQSNSINFFFYLFDNKSHIVHHSFIKSMLFSDWQSLECLKDFWINDKLDENDLDYCGVEYVLKRYGAFIENTKKKVESLMEAKGIKINDLSSEPMTIFNLINKERIIEIKNMNINENFEEEDITETVDFEDKDKKRSIGFFLGTKLVHRGHDCDDIIYNPIKVRAWEKDGKLQIDIYLSTDNLTVGYAVVDNYRSSDNLTVGSAALNTINTFDSNFFCVLVAYEKYKEEIVSDLKDLVEIEPQRVSDFLFRNFKNIKDQSSETGDNVEIMEEGYDYEKFFEMIQFLEKEKDESKLRERLPTIIDEFNKIKTKYSYLDKNKKLKDYTLNDYTFCGFNRGYYFVDSKCFGSDAPIIPQTSKNDTKKSSLEEYWLDYDTNSTIKFAPKAIVLSKQGSICPFSGLQQTTDHAHALNSIYSDYKEQ
jgi:hypothetical protein